MRDFKNDFSSLLLKIIVSGLLFTALSFFVDLRAQDSEEVVLSFISGQCETLDQNFCKYAQPKEWSLSEKELFRESFLKYQKSFPRFFERISYNGVIILQRFESSAVKTDHGWIRERSAAWIDKNSKQQLVASFSDAIFEAGIDTLTGISRFEQGFMHEMAHIFDKKSDYISYSPQFLKKSGCTKVLYPPKKWNFSVNDKFEKLSILAENGKLEEAIRENRFLGVKYGFPTLYAMTSPGECFAEMISYFIVDTKAVDYLGNNIVGYIHSLLSYK